VKARKRTGGGESSLELKYCERCGGLWLRPVGGKQIYCRICSRAMAELPAATTEVKRKSNRRNDWEVEEEFEGYTIGEIEPDEAGGWA
jgi:Zn-finger nucleic acid-binding protein